MSAKRITRISSERAQLARLSSFIVLTAHALNCNLVLSLKRALRKHSASIKFYRNASVKLALCDAYPNTFSKIKGQHMFLIIEQNVLEVCKLVTAFVQANDVRIKAFVWTNAVYNIECVRLISQTDSETELRANALFALKSALSRFVTTLSFPLISFVSLLNNKSAHV